MKQIRFDNGLGCLVDDEETLYEGRRFDSLSTDSEGSFSSQDGAKMRAIYRLKEIAENRGADAYEIIDTSIYDSRQEYDSTPYSATVSAILYRLPEKQ